MKKAILVVSFGTTYKETRQKTIEACENKIIEELSGYDFYRAYTSEKVIKKIQELENIYVDNIIEALDKLYKNSYKEVIIQPLHIICGQEFNKLLNQFEHYKHKFEKLSLGRPLLAYEDDYKEVVSALKIQIKQIEKNEAIIFIGHGSSNNENDIYSSINTMLMNEYINTYLVTLENYFQLNKIIKILKKENIDVVNLMPFMLVAGYHVIKDIMSDDTNSLKSILSKNGFEVKVHIQGLGENIKIQEKFANHAKNCYIS